MFRLGRGGEKLAERRRGGALSGGDEARGPDEVGVGEGGWQTRRGFGREGSERLGGGGSADFAAGGRRGAGDGFEAWTGDEATDGFGEGETDFTWPRQPSRTN